MNNKSDEHPCAGLSTEQLLNVITRLQTENKTLRDGFLRTNEQLIAANNETFRRGLLKGL